MGNFLAVGPGIERGPVLEGARLIDVPPTILHAMELPVSSDMDGNVLTEFFTDREREVASIHLAPDQGSGQNYLLEDEEQQIKEKLRAGDTSDEQHRGTRAYTQASERSTVFQAPEPHPQDRKISGG